MSDLKQQLQVALKAAMKTKDSDRRNAIRLLNSAIKQVEVDARDELDDEGVLKVLQKESKKHRETIAELEAAGRGDDSAGARFELALIEEFLPSQLADRALRDIVTTAVSEAGAVSMQDMGKIMKIVMPQIQGRADGKRVSAIVRESLG